MLVQAPASLLPVWEIQLAFRHSGFIRSRHGCCEHSGSEPGEGRELSHHPVISLPLNRLNTQLQHPDNPVNASVVTDSDNGTRNWLLLCIWENTVEFLAPSCRPCQWLGQTTGRGSVHGGCMFLSVCLK